MAVRDIFNFIGLDENVALGGQPTAAQLQDARDEGFAVVINLLPSTQDNALSGEDAIVAALGLDYHYIPVSWTDPRIADVESFIGAMDAAGGRKLLIHCAANYRVTAFYSLYAMRRLGWSTEQADALIARIWESRPDFRMEGNWKALVEEARRSIAAG
jgi:uncharacterized protein (TIGR01244 family)